MLEQFAVVKKSGSSQCLINQNGALLILTVVSETVPKILTGFSLAPPVHCLSYNKSMGIFK
jgi:hypothetical protein